MQSLEVGSVARVTQYVEHNHFTERLRELGLTEGAEFHIVRKAPFNGPVHIRCGHCNLIVRADETRYMNVECVGTCTPHSRA